MFGSARRRCSVGRDWDRTGTLPEPGRQSSVRAPGPSFVDLLAGGVVVASRSRGRFDRARDARFNQPAKTNRLRARSTEFVEPARRRFRASWRTAQGKSLRPHPRAAQRMAPLFARSASRRGIILGRLSVSSPKVLSCRISSDQSLPDLRGHTHDAAQSLQVRRSSCQMNSPPALTARPQRR